jgi:hypothetical protein
MKSSHSTKVLVTANDTVRPPPHFVGIQSHTINAFPSDSRFPHSQHMPRDTATIHWVPPPSVRPVLSHVVAQFRERTSVQGNTFYFLLLQRTKQQQHHLQPWETKRILLSSPPMPVPPPPFLWRLVKSRREGTLLFLDVFRRMSFL